MKTLKELVIEYVDCLQEKVDLANLFMEHNEMTRWNDVYNTEEGSDVVSRHLNVLFDIMDLTSKDNLTEEEVYTTRYYQILNSSKVEPFYHLNINKIETIEDFIDNLENVFLYHRMETRRLDTIAYETVKKLAKAKYNFDTVEYMKNPNEYKYIPLLKEFLDDPKVIKQQENIRKFTSSINKTVYELENIYLDLVDFKGPRFRTF